MPHSLEWHVPSFLSLCHPDCRHAAVKQREERDKEGGRGEETLWGDNEKPDKVWMNEWGGGKWLKKEWIKSEKKESKARGRSVIKTQGEEDEERTGERREGTVIDCLVSPHAPVTELIGVAKTKRREVSVTSEPFSRRAVHVKLRWDEPPPAFSPPSSLSATQRRCCESARKVKLHSFFAGIKKKI